MFVKLNKYSLSRGLNEYFKGANECFTHFFEKNIIFLVFPAARRLQLNNETSTHVIKSFRPQKS